MLLILSALLLYSVLIIYLLYRRLYIGAFFNAIIYLYEFTGPFFYFFPHLPDLPGLSTYNLFADDQSVKNFMILIIFFVATINASYFATLTRYRTKIHGSRKISIHERYANIFGTNNINRCMIVFLIFFIIISGVASMYTGAGSSMLLDYVGEESQGSRIMSYGMVLILPLFAYSIILLYNRIYMKSFLIVVSCLPLLVEMFLTGRRQYLAPMVVIVFLFLLYNSKYKYRRSFCLLVLSIVAFGFQYSFRENIAYGYAQISDSFIKGLIYPQIGEFCGVGTISLRSLQLLRNEDYTYGLHFILGILNAIPFIRLGDMLFPTYTDLLSYIHKRLAPWGGFTMFSDAYLALSVTGVFMASIILGYAVAFFEKKATSAFYGRTLSVKNIYYMSLISILLLKYRSGIVDSIFAIINFSLLYLSIYLVSLVVVRIRR